MLSAEVKLAAAITHMKTIRTLVFFIFFLLTKNLLVFFSQNQSAQAEQ
jgi:hypothetical protein